MENKFIDAHFDENGNIIIECNGDRVLTTLQLIDALGCSRDFISHRYASHKDYFVEGTHFYKATGLEMSALRKKVNNAIAEAEEAAENLHMSNLHVAKSSADAVQATADAAENLQMLLHVPDSHTASLHVPDSHTAGAAQATKVMRPKAIQIKSRHCYLWTKRGIARFCKMIDSPLAWEVFNALENNYFAKTKNSAPAPAPADPPVVTPVVESAPPPKPYQVPDSELSIRERIDILSKCLDYTDSKNLRNKLITDIAYLVTRKNY